MNERELNLIVECNCVKNYKISDPAIDISLLEPDLIKYEGAGSEGNIINILQRAQELYGYLPVDLIVYISRRTGVKPAKIMGIVTFYTQFRIKPVGKNLILLCQGTACHVNGSADIEESIREYLQVPEGEITPDGLFTYNNVACIGCCSLSPVMMIGDKAYGNLTKESAVKVLENIKKEAAL